VFDQSNACLHVVTSAASFLRAAERVRRSPAASRENKRAPIPISDFADKTRAIEFSSRSVRLDLAARYVSRRANVSLRASRTS